jgi:hypothetical protein
MGNTQVEHRTERAADEGMDVASPRRTGLRSRRAKGVGALAALVLAATAFVGFADPADAAEASPDGADAPTMAEAPSAPAVASDVDSCVWESLDDSGGTDELTVYNDCEDAVRVKVILAFHTDLPCRTIFDGESRDYEWDWPGRYDGLEYC